LVGRILLMLGKAAMFCLRRDCKVTTNSRCKEPGEQARPHMGKRDPCRRRVLFAKSADRSLISGQERFIVNERSRKTIQDEIPIIILSNPTTPGTIPA
jgi:hypothetical protein